MCMNELIVYNMFWSMSVKMIISELPSATPVLESSTSIPTIGLTELLRESTQLPTGNFCPKSNKQYRKNKHQITH